jgi:hypothetical protein
VYGRSRNSETWDRLSVRVQVLAAGPVEASLVGWEEGASESVGLALVALAALVASEVALAWS